MKPWTLPRSELFSLLELARATDLETLPETARIAITDLAYDWRTRARDAQLDPGFDDWIVLYQTGRGWGKSRTVHEIARDRIDRGTWRTVMLAAPTAADLGLSLNGSEDAPGLLGLWPPHRKPYYTEAQNDPRVVCWNGAKIRMRSAQRPDRFRGPNNDGVVADEIDSWVPEKNTPSHAFALLEMTCRGMRQLQLLASSTPKRGRLVAELAARPDCRVIRGAMAENRGNLSDRFVAVLERRYGGTRLGRQELLGELLENVEGAFVTPAMIDAARVSSPPALLRIVVGVDPSGSTTGDMQGIVPVGIDYVGHTYALEDRSCSLSPEGWGRRAVETYCELEADAICVERNYGGDMAESVITQAAKARGVSVRVLGVNATRAKHVRFEPVGLLHEQGRAHVVGSMPELEDELCSFTPLGYSGLASPNRADAYVWAVTELALKRGLTASDLYGADVEGGSARAAV